MGFWIGIFGLSFGMPSVIVKDKILCGFFWVGFGMQSVSHWLGFGVTDVIRSLGCKFSVWQILKSICIKVRGGIFKCYLTRVESNNLIISVLNSDYFYLT